MYGDVDTTPNLRMRETEFQYWISLNAGRGPTQTCSHTLITSLCTVGSVQPDDSKANTTNVVRRLVSGCTSARAALYPAILLSMAAFRLCTATSRGRLCRC